MDATIDGIRVTSVQRPKLLDARHRTESGLDRDLFVGQLPQSIEPIADGRQIAPD